jgi:uridine kinase
MTPENKKLINIKLSGDRTITINAGTTLLELSKSLEKECRARILAARVDNSIKELTSELTEDCSVKFIDITDDDGIRIYRRSLHYVLIKAAHDLFPKRRVLINHSISKGMYIEIIGDKPLEEDEVKMLGKRMEELVAMKIPFEKRQIPLEEARNIFVKSGRLDRFHVIEYRAKPYVTVYRCGDLDDYFYGYMVPDTSYVDKFGLVYYTPGLILLFPEKSNPDVVPEFVEQKKLFSIFTEYKKWGHILEVDNIGALNDVINSGGIDDLMRVSEALHEKKIAQIADVILENCTRRRIVLIAGPSSSGKTTFAKRLSVQLRVNGLKPYTISVDDYFLDRDATPKDENGDFNYESLEALDLKLFNENLATLIEGEETELPIYNFMKGQRSPNGTRIKLNDDQVILIEGIHGLNDRLTSAIPPGRKLKIYISDLTSINIDDHNRISSTDTRLIRRIVRDSRFRSSDAVSTIKRWPSVRRGEEKFIFPFQETADVMFNSALIFELGVLRVFAEPLLEKIDNSVEEYSEARRLVDFLANILPIDAESIPSNSIIREFIGGCCFYKDVE